MSADLDDLMGNPLAEPLNVLEDDSDVFEIDVVDDRPEDDQVEPRSSESDDNDSEIEEVGGRAQKRINKLKYEFHEERRSKEAAERMREEAVRYAEQVAQENQQLKEVLERGEKVLISEMRGRADAALEKARIDYKTAYESGDPDQLIVAQEALNRSQSEKMMAERSVPQMENAPPPPPPPKAPDPRLERWLGDNSWFGKDREMTSFAYGVHEKLVMNDGVNPESEEYYQKIDQRMREVFPSQFGVDTGAEEPAASRRSSTVVAPADRSSGKPRRVQLTSTQVALAKRLGITPEQYAKQLLKEIG
tara:strand:- start:2052 stop:2966 length:915 start_codon:yes stop_codon:yes gene_type:complete